MKVNKKSGTAKMKTDVEAGKKIKALRGSLTQAQFAASLQVAQPMISAWEAGRELPASADLWIKFGNIAPYPENLWFWGRAGVDPQLMLSTYEKTMIERSAPIAEGEIIRVPCFVKMEGKDVGWGDPIVVPRAFVPHPASTIFRYIDGPLASPTVQFRTYLLLDTFFNDSPTLLPFWNSTIAVEDDSVNPDREKWVSDVSAAWEPFGGRLQIGVLRQKYFWDVSNEQGGRPSIRSIAALASHVDAVSDIPAKTERYTGKKPREIGEWINIYEGSAASKEQLLAFDAETRKRALNEIRLAKSFHILGLVLGRFRAIPRVLQPDEE
jgi:DNA-binding XRE family transcriptional regulator